MFQKADIFAFGVTIWELLHRTIPWDSSETKEIEIEVAKGNRLPIIFQLNPKNQRKGTSPGGNRLALNQRKLESILL